MIREVTEKHMQRNSLHGEGAATYTVFEHKNKTILQIDTYGSAARDIPGKASQTLQVDEIGARELLAILKTTFGPSK
jgi:hypothetical protein